MTSAAERMRAMSGSVHVALDEGGARCTWGGGAGYVRFAEIEDVSLANRLIGSPRLVLATAGGAIAMKIANAELLHAHGAIARHLEEARAHGCWAQRRTVTRPSRTQRSRT